MNTKIVLIITAFLTSQIGLAQEKLSGKVENYPFGAADLMSVKKMFGVVKTGTIDASGKFTVPLNDDYFQKLTKKVSNYHKAHPGSLTLPKYSKPSTMDKDAIKITNGDQPKIELFGRKGLMVRKNTVDPLGFLMLLSDKSFAESKMFSYHEKAKKGYYVDWFYVEKPLKAKGTSIKTQKIRGPEDETYQVKASMDLNLKPGWNMVKIGINEVFHAQNGKTFIKGLYTKSIDEIPAEAKFYFFKN